MSNGLLPIGVNPSITRAVEPSVQNDHTEIQSNFSNVLKNALEHVSETEHASNVKTQLFAAGQIDDLHDVMITAQKASITVETAVQMQQKVIDAYNEVMRMQI